MGSCHELIFLFRLAAPSSSPLPTPPKKNQQTTTTIDVENEKGILKNSGANRESYHNETIPMEREQR
jgi:hypothetical protein